MNHLAHALLAGPDPALRLGGLLGDYVRGRTPTGWDPRVLEGIALHRAIDSFTDGHREVRAARELLPPPYRRFAGIALDMWFDHCLARDFPRWAGQPLQPFSQALRALLQGHRAELPAALQRLTDYMQRHDLPAGYARPDQIARALQGISQRLSRANPLAGAIDPLQRQAVPLQAHFEAFFPELQAFAADWRQRRALP